MPGLKKPSRRKETTSPNLVLVIFLVFFVLLSIGLGIWGYYGYAGQADLLAKRKDAEKKEQSEKTESEYRRTIADTLLMALGHPLNDEEKAIQKEYYKVFNDEAGKFKSSKDYDEFKKALDDLRQKLQFDEQTGEFKSSYAQTNASLGQKLKDTEDLLAKTQKDLKLAQNRFQELQVAQEKYWKNALDKINEVKEENLKAARSKSEEVAQMAVNFNKVNEELQNADREANARQQKQDIEIRTLRQQLADKAQTREATPQIRGSEPHALLLDISRGKLLWDTPVGKITRVDMAQRQVTLNLGSSRGVRPELTFLVFGPGPHGGAEKHIKGTVEVMRILDANTSLGRITSLYDANGEEIQLTANNQGRIQRETEAALREGDLLYHPFWGSHVAIAGPVSLTGVVSDNPAEQMRQLNDFIYYLERQGMPVDAFLDLNDGQVKGAMTAKTRFLIRGVDLTLSGKETQSERAKAINEAVQAMRKEATERGEFIVSVDNFLNLVGFRTHRSGVSDASPFRPTLPAAGAGSPGIVGQSRQPNVAEEPMPPMKEEKEN